MADDLRDRIKVGYPTSDYVFWKSIDNRLSLYKRKLDGTIYVGQLSTLHDTEEEKRIYELIDRGAGDAAAKVLNHENLVSIHNEVVYQDWQPDQDRQEAAYPRHLILYDYCDAGTLQTLLNRPHVKRTLTGPFMPESLCWHVAFGLLRALQWLHEGIRDNYNVSEDVSSARSWTRQTRCHRIRTRTEPQLGWFPILHRNITAANVLLSHPKGIETYGPVKLGGLHGCIVTGGILQGNGVKPEDAPAVGWDKTADPWSLEQLEPSGIELREWYGKWKQKGLKQPRSQRPYTTGNDLWAVGAILYEMMFGLIPPAAEECNGGGCSARHWYKRSWEPKDKPHVQSNPNCMLDLDLDSFPDRLNYSKELKALLKRLMSMNRQILPRASQILDQAWSGYQVWAANTNAGKIYRDVYDDIWFRRQNEWRMVKQQQKGLAPPADYHESKELPESHMKII